MLIDRDDLYMQQDAILVDVEDFTKYNSSISILFCRLKVRLGFESICFLS